MTSLNSHAKDLSHFWKGEILWNKPMSHFSTLKVGGPAEAIISVSNSKDLKRLILWLKENNIDRWLVGRGSNILVPDHGLAGVTIVLAGEFSSIKIPAVSPEKLTGNKTLVRAGAACPLSRLVSYCTAQGLSGLEFAVGIPGSIGGAIVMNAGAWGGEIGNLLHSATLMDDMAELSVMERKSFSFRYRDWGMGSNKVLLYASFALTPCSTEEVKAACHRYQELRQKNQPLAEASAGSFFKNPPEQSAGHLIDAAGLKGHTIGGAQISEKHANFIINTGNASAADIFHLMRLVQERVYKRFGIRLEPEVRILGGREEKI